jgi:hypothetical protein
MLDKLANERHTHKKSNKCSVCCNVQLRKKRKQGERERGKLFYSDFDGHNNDDEEKRRAIEETMDDYTETDVTILIGHVRGKKERIKFHIPFCYARLEIFNCPFLFLKSSLGLVDADVMPLKLTRTNQTNARSRNPKKGFAIMIDI